MNGSVTPIKPPAEDPFHQVRVSARFLRLRSLTYMAWRYLLFKKMRSALTILGVAIGIGAIMFLISFSLGLQRLVTKQVIGSKTVNLIDVTTSKPNTIKLNDEMVNRISKMPHITGVDKSYSFAGRLNVNNATTDAVIYGADKDYLSLLSLKFAAGEKNLKNNDSAFVSTALLQAIGITDNNKALGQKIKITVAKPTDDDSKATYSTEVTIIGVIDNNTGSEVYTTDTLFINAGFSDYSQLKAVVDKPSSITTAKKQIESLGLITESPADTISEINQVFSIFTVIVAGFGGIGLVVAILGMFNTLTISLLERTREIGLLSALGARRRDIASIFFTEAIFLSVIGSVTGIIVSWLAGTFINLVVTLTAHSRGITDNISLFYTNPLMIVLVLIFSILIATLVVAYPAHRAAHINPIDALRHD